MDDIHKVEKAAIVKIPTPLIAVVVETIIIDHVFGVYSNYELRTISTHMHTHICMPADWEQPPSL